jgi:hypothetical protein
MIADCVTQTLKDHGLHTERVEFSGDNTNTDFGGINRSGNKNVFHDLKHELQKELVSAGCPAYTLTTAYIQHEADTMSVDIDCFIMKIYNYFSIYLVRTEDLNSYCEFVDINYRQLLSRSKTRCLSLFPAV